jgi:glyoxylase-like metal-dependent hydrolase (beta-lactamase superfamily II)
MKRKGRALPASRHFELEQIGEGIYAALISDLPAHIAGNANAGVVDLGDVTLVFDTFLTPAAAGDLCAAAEALTGRLPDYVVNSHCHDDHIRGNQAFPDQAVVISTTATRERIATEGAANLRHDADNAAAELREFEARLAAESDPARQEFDRLMAAQCRAIVDSLPALRLRLPDCAFDSVLEVHGSRRTARMISLGGGHTASDAFLVLPEERVAFLGDLLFVGHHPYLCDGDPDALTDTLTAVRHLGVTTVVPGHGPVGTAADLETLRQYVDDLQGVARAVAAAGGSADDAAARPAPAPYADWRFDFFLPMNLRFLYERREAARHEHPGRPE